jgi:hypothetical protein
VDDSKIRGASMQTKVIAADTRVKVFMGVKVDLYVECKGLLATIYHHAVQYDDYMSVNNISEANIHLDSMNILDKVFTATVSEQFDIHDKLSLIGEAGSLCLRMIQEAKDNKIKIMCRKLLVRNNRLLISILEHKNTPTD